MRANFVHIEEQLRSVLLDDVVGDIAELGVWRGTTFLPMAELARMAGRVCHAVDSFKGLPKATDRDGSRYPEGTYDVGGPADFRDLVRSYSGTVKIHEGFVPAILEELTDVMFAFVHLDLDQHGPTLDALRFLWPRMTPGGVLMCHDWARNRLSLAAGGIADWMAETGVELAGERDSGHCWFVKAAE